MSFVSYAQNYEDVMLARALRGVERGFYIDVGAQDPINDSVTKAFYEREWHGINIEPVTHWFNKLAEDRTRDINLKIAISDKPGFLHLFEVADSGLSTTDRGFAELHRKAGHLIHESDVPCVTLDELCEQHCLDEVHFLKLDCEGAEVSALRGISLERVRPWIILLEATEPNSQKPTHDEWESLLTTRGYHFVYQDGLNRFYVADEHGELDDAFVYPPNVFDYFVRAPEAMAREELAATRGELVALRDGVRHLHDENERREAALVEHRRQLESAAESVAAANASSIRLNDEIAFRDLELNRLQAVIELRDQELGRFQAMIEAIQRSASWRVTYPLRFAKRTARMLSRLIRRMAYAFLRPVARMVRPCLRWLARSERLCSLCARVAGSDSWLASRTRLFLFGAPAVEGAVAEQILDERSECLTRSALQMAGEIDEARKRHAKAIARAHSGEV